MGQIHPTPRLQNIKKKSLQTVRLASSDMYFIILKLLYLTRVEKKNSDLKGLKLNWFDGTRNQTQVYCSGVGGSNTTRPYKLLLTY